MKRPPDSLRSFPPKGEVSSFGTAVRNCIQPPDSLRSFPPKGEVSSFGTAVRN